MHRYLIAALLLAAAAIHVTWCARYAWAGILASEDSAPALNRAVRLAPANASYYARLAAVDPDHATQWLDTALRIHPTDSALWIERGVNAEVGGDAAGAEASLLEAARRDRQYVPLWTLAAFYYRQRNIPKFESSARQAFEMAWGDAMPLFQMAGQLGIPLSEIRRTMLPDRAPVLAAFIAECLRRGSLDEALETAQRVIEIGGMEHRGTGFAAVDALFRAGRTADAAGLWNRMSSAHWMPHPAITPSSLVTNPEFSFEFLPQGFDWHPSIIDGVVFWRFGNGRGLQIELSGRQPESCSLMTLPLPLDPSRFYILDVQASGLPAGTGLKWKLGNREWEAAENLKVDLKSGAAPLALVYNRALGTKRVAGTLTIRRVTIAAFGDRP